AAVYDGIALPLGALIDEAAGLAVGLRPFAGTQHLHRGADGLHDRSAGVRIDVVHVDAVVGAAVGDGGEALEGFVGRVPLILQQRRIGLVPGRRRRAQGRASPRRRAVVDR